MVNMILANATFTIDTVFHKFIGATLAIVLAVGVIGLLIEIAPPTVRDVIVAVIRRLKSRI